jgi:L-galactose dehydrogenase
MDYRPLGQTGLRVSRIGFGASPFGDVFGTTTADERTRAVQAAIDSGINFFDVSPYYGETLAETRLGEALGTRRSQVILATKCGRYSAQGFDFSPARVRASIEESLRRLRTDHVDILHAHDIEFGNAEQIIHETIPAMRALQREGKVRFIGITGYPLKLLARVAEAAPVDVVLSYCHYNLLATDMDDVLTPFAKRAHMGLINASPLSMGLLTRKGPPSWHPASPALIGAARQAARLCDEAGIDVAHVALRFALDHSVVATTLVGISSPVQVQSAISTLNTANDPGLLERLRLLLEPVHNMPWQSGRPENAD